MSTAAASPDADLARMVDESLERILRIERLLEAAARDEALPPDVTADLTGLGWAGIAVAEELGGLGLKPTTLAELAWTAGRRLLPAAFRGETFLLTPSLARLAPRDEWAAERLDELLAGRARGGATSLGESLAGTVTVDGGAVEFDAVELLATLGPGARAVACAGEGWLVVVDLDDAMVRVDAVRGLDRGQGAARLTLDGRIDSALALVGPESEAIRCGWLLACACEALGAGRRALVQAVAYAGQRHQFGRPIADFQAVSHALAAAAVALEAAEAGVGRAVALEGKAAGEVVDALRYAAPRAARQACETAIQVHGGIGFSWELGLHLAYRRVLELQAALGGESGSARRLGTRYLAGTVS